MTDIVSNMDLDVFPILGMILFCIAFSIIVFSVFKRGARVCERDAQLPLEDDAPTTRGDRAANTAGVNHG